MFERTIVCAYLYIITRYGYPPNPELTEKYLSEMRNLGFQSVELEGIGEQHLKTMYKMRDEIREKLDEYSLSVPFFCAVLPGLSSFENEVRSKNLRLFEMGCEIAQLLGSRGVLDNSPIPPYRFQNEFRIARHYDESEIGRATFPEQFVWDSYWKELIETYRTACDIAASYNLTYQMHPAIGCLASTTDGFMNFKSAVGRDNLRFTFDTANLYVMKENLSLGLLRLADSIDYIHLSDNSGNRIEHLVPGEGNIHWGSFFETLRKINFKGIIGLDIGGAESKIEDLNGGYRSSAQWLSSVLEDWNYNKELR